MEDRQLSLSEVAGLMGVSERTVRRWIKAGKLRAFKPGRDYRIPVSAVRTFVEESEISPKAGTPSWLEPTFNDVLAEGRREDINEVALEAARQQLKQDRQAANRALESERPQTYFKHYENAAVIRLLEYPQDELAGALIELARSYVELEEATERGAEQTAARPVPRARSGMEGHLTIRRTWEDVEDNLTAEQVREILEGVRDGRITVDAAARQVEKLVTETA